MVDEQARKSENALSLLKLLQALAAMANPLYLFTLPPTLLSELTQRQLSLPTQIQIPKSAAIIEEPRESSQNGLFLCRITAQSFDSLIELKEHYKSDYYKFNLKLNQQSKPSITPTAFDQLIHGSYQLLIMSDKTLTEFATRFTKFTLWLRFFTLSPLYSFRPFIFFNHDSTSHEDEL